MKVKLIIAVLLIASLAVGVAAASGNNRNFRTHLSGDEEVPARDTQAQGQVIFQVSKDGSSIDYKLIVANIDNVRAAHIHCGALGVNGPVGVTLFAGGGLGSVNGILAQGTITDPDTVNSCGWTTLAEVIAAMESGDTYVNVHTNDGVDPTNTGPGDFPGGEIRGQID